jgi:hypothetical protein
MRVAALLVLLCACTLHAQSVLISVGPAGEPVRRNSSRPIALATGNVTYVTSRYGLGLPDPDYAYFFIRDATQPFPQSLALNSIGEPANQSINDSFQTAVSAEGRYALFVSRSTNLSPLSIDNSRQLYLRDRTLGTTRILTRPFAAPPEQIAMYGFGVGEIVISGDGKTAAYQCSGCFAEPDYESVVIHRLDTGERFVAARDVKGFSSNGLVSIGLDYTGSKMVFIAGTGKFIPAYDPTEPIGDGAARLYVVDLATRRIRWLNRAPQIRRLGDLWGNCVISGNGKSVIFSTRNFDETTQFYANATNIVAIDLATESLETISQQLDGDRAENWSLEPSVDFSGRFVAYASQDNQQVAGDTNNIEDVFLRDRLLQRTIRLSVNSQGQQVPLGGGMYALGSPDPLDHFLELSVSLSSDAKYVAYISFDRTIAPGITTPAFNVIRTTVPPSFLAPLAIARQAPGTSSMSLLLGALALIIGGWISLRPSPLFRR